MKLRTLGLHPAVWAILVFLPVRASAQEKSDAGPDMALTPAVRTEVIEGALKRLNAAYVFPETAKKMAAAIHDRLSKKEYDTITSARALAKKLTADLQTVSNDKHLRVSFSAEPLPKFFKREPTPKEREEMRQLAAQRNFGFEKVERLAGNIGYLDLRGFMPANLAGETAAAAMNFLANTDALIIDLRKNGGGAPGMVALLCTYLFPDHDTVHLNDLYFRPSNETRQWWTLPYVAGKRYVKKKVYLLTSKRTFSAAEEFTYNLKNLKRVTIVGETTGGGAHPGGPQPINDHFAVWVPSGRAINPISKTNWEGTGVKPDIEVAADLALTTAHLDALKKIKPAAAKDPDRTKELDKLIDKLQRELQQSKPGDRALRQPPAAIEDEILGPVSPAVTLPPISPGRNAGANSQTPQCAPPPASLTWAALADC